MLCFKYIIFSLWQCIFKLLLLNIPIILCNIIMPIRWTVFLVTQYKIGNTLGLSKELSFFSSGTKTIWYDLENRRKTSCFERHALPLARWKQARHQFCSCIQNCSMCSFCLKEEKILPKDLMHFLIFMVFYLSVSHQLIQYFNVQNSYSAAL